MEVRFLGNFVNNFAILCFQVFQELGLGSFDLFDPTVCVKVCELCTSFFVDGIWFNGSGTFSKSELKFRPLLSEVEQAPVQQSNMSKRDLLYQQSKDPDVEDILILILENFLLQSSF
ncbi:hypothetical protein MKX03_019934 [Papaver bracteatum]|nr:hypothetical protein MKX03_019934 [Papaver bracteatum]